MEDELESLREKSARASSLFDELEADDGLRSSTSFFSRFSPQQRLILAILLFIDIIACLVLVILLRTNILG